MLGSRLLEALEPKGAVGTATSRLRPGLLHCDITNIDKTIGLIGRLRPKIIIHAAGMTRPDQCETDPGRAWQVNVAPVAQIALAANQSKVLLFSTDYVFDGGRGGYTEFDTPNPINHYGRTKYAAEQELLRAAPDSLVVRVGGLFGWSSGNREWLDQFLTQQEMCCSEDHSSSYTFIDDIARVLEDLCAHTGVVHLVGPDVFTRKDFALLVCEKLNLNAKVRGVPGTIAYSHTKRPKDSSLRMARLTYKMTSASEALDLLARRL